jgi:hypothetical protein
MVDEELPNQDKRAIELITDALGCLCEEMRDIRQALNVLTEQGKVLVENHGKFEEWAAQHDRRHQEKDDTDCAWRASHAELHNRLVQRLDQLERVISELHPH